MGFLEDQARAALRAALGNPDLAVEFLTTGIPDDFQVRLGSCHNEVPTLSTWRRAGSECLRKIVLRPLGTDMSLVPLSQLYSWRTSVLYNVIVWAITVAML